MWGNWDEFPNLWFEILVFYAKTNAYEALLFMLVLPDLQRKWLLEVQVVGMLCRTPRKESRQELLRRVAGGGGTFNSEDGGTVVLPSANLNDIANQADDLLETMEEKPSLPDRRLLARLVLIREEARSMMGGGILDERNDRGLSTLPDAEVAQSYIPDPSSGDLKMVFTALCSHCVGTAVMATLQKLLPCNVQQILYPKDYIGLCKADVSF
eukprot:Gb_18809 [translate_table: standard]